MLILEFIVNLQQQEQDFTLAGALIFLQKNKNFDVKEKIKGDGHCTEVSYVHSLMFYKDLRATK